MGKAAIHSLLVPLDRGAGASLQEQLCEGVRRAISAGRLAPGGRLPSARELTSALKVSRTTVSLALEQLIAEGWLVARARSGTFVSERPLPDLPKAATGAPRSSPLHLSRAASQLVEKAQSAPGLRPRAFRLSRPALDLFPMRVWNRLLAKRAARLSVQQLDYDQDSPRLRQAVAGLVSASRGMSVDPEQVLLFAGSQRAVAFAAATLLERGQAAWMEDPGYAMARQVLVSAGATVADVPVDGEGLVVSEGLRLAPEARLAFVTPSNQFPLGVVMSLERRHALLRWADTANACVVEDDYDVEFSEAGARLPALHALDASGRVLYAASFSRTMFPALRLGYLIAPPPLAPRLRAARAALEEQLPSLEQLALADFIADGHFARHVRRMRLAYRARREALLEAARSAGLPAIHAEGLHAVAGLPPGCSAAEVAAAAARRHIEVLPLSDFCARASPPEALLLGFGAVRPEEMRDAVRELGAAIEETRRSAPTRSRRGR